jgi:hypothetical protein
MRLSLLLPHTHQCEPRSVLLSKQCPQHPTAGHFAAQGSTPPTWMDCSLHLPVSGLYPVPLTFHTAAEPSFSCADLIALFSQAPPMASGAFSQVQVQHLGQTLAFPPTGPPACVLSWLSQICPPFKLLKAFLLLLQTPPFPPCPSQLGLPS